MGNVETIKNDTGSDFLVFSDLFSGADEINANIALLPEIPSAAGIYKLIKMGSFALGRQAVINAFAAAGGSTANGRPANLKAVIKLCLEVTAESYKSNNSASQLRIWFDPFSGRLELVCSNGQKDSLTVWTSTNRAAA